MKITLNIEDIKAIVHNYLVQEISVDIEWDSIELVSTDQYPVILATMEIM